MWILPAVALLGFTSLALAARLGLRERPAWLLGLYLLSFAQPVLMGQILSFAGRLDRVDAWLGLHALLALGAGWLWHAGGRPDLFAPLRGLRAGLRSLRSAPLESLFAAGIGLVVAASAALIVIVPPNNNDSLSTHLSRIGYWLQHGSFLPWPTSRILQVIYPVDAQLNIFWTVVFTRSERLVGAVQWLAALACAAGVGMLARQMGARRRAAAFAALVFLSFPLVILQSTTPQNDLVAAALYMACTAFFLRAFAAPARPALPSLLLSALALGLGLGTKQTVYFLLPGLGLLALASAWKAGRPGLRALLRWGMAALAAFVLFGASLNWINLRTFGSPFGPPDLVESSVGGERIESLLYNVPRLALQSIDVSGLPNPLDGYAYKAIGRAARAVFLAVGLDLEGTRFAMPGHSFAFVHKNEMQEDHAWYGPLSWALLGPCMLAAFVQGLRRRDPARIFLPLSALLFLGIDAALRPGWDPFQGRYFAPVVAVNAAFLALLDRPGRVWSGLRAAAALLAVIIAVNVTLYNPAKPLVGKQARNVPVLTADRITVMTVQAFFMREPLRMVERLVPSDAVLGLYTPGYMWDYPLFGPRFTRRLVPIYPFESVSDLNRMKSQGIQYLLVQEGIAPVPALPPGLDEDGRVEGWVLYQLP